MAEIADARAEIDAQLGEYMAEQRQKLTDLERRHHALMVEIAGLTGRFGYLAETRGNADLAELVGLLSRAIGAETVEVTP